MISPLLELPGAVPPPEPSVDPGVAWHHGDPLRSSGWPSVTWWWWTARTAR